MLCSMQDADRAQDSGARARLVAACFREKFTGEPELWARAPGRVDLMGSHTDYNLGFVLTLPIARDTWIAARRRDDDTVRVHSMNLDEGDRFRWSDIAPVPGSRWRNYVRGVVATLREEGLALAGCDAVVHSTVPIEAGLSSSAAIECALATVFESLGGWSLTPERKALLCQKAENEFVGVKCGILDQYSSCLGRRGCALLLDCRDLSTRAVRIADGIRVVVCNTMSPRRVAGRGAHGGRPAGGGAALRAVLRGRTGSLRNLLSGDGDHDGGNARGAGRDRRAPGGGGIRRLHGGSGGGRTGGRVPGRRPGRLCQLRPRGAGNLPG